MQQNQEAINTKDNPLPLYGLKVIELGQVIAGPFSTAILSDLGADVIKIERPEVGDDARYMGPEFEGGASLNFHIFNRGKKSLELGLKSTQGIEVLHQLLACSDILVHNLRPGVAETLGLGGKDLCERHPRLIYCELSAYGRTGPMRSNPGYEPLIQAFSGISSVNGGPGDPPIRVAPSICDQGAGMWAVIGILALLHNRHDTGYGGLVETSLLETALVWLSPKIDSYANQGLLPQRHASGHPDFVPYQSFEAKDGPILICAGNDRLFAKLAAELGRPEWSSNERYATNRARLQNQGQLLKEISEILKLQTRASWIDRLTQAGIPNSPINSVPEALAHEQTDALGLRQGIPGHGFELVGLPISFNGVRPRLRHAAPKLGVNNAEILGPTEGLLP